MKSQYADRETVGSIYIEAQKDTTKGLLLQDFNNPMVVDFVEDLNVTITSNPYDGRPFYINVVEERDLQMKNAFKRRMFTTLYRPYPEDNTLVYYTEPKNEKTYFCWDIPHHSEFYNVLSNFTLYDNEYIARIREWTEGDLSNLGFIKVHITGYEVEGYERKTVDAYRKSYLAQMKDRGMDEKALESEERLGYFWIPNKKYRYKDVTQKKVPKLFT